MTTTVDPTRDPEAAIQGALRILEPNTRRGDALAIIGSTDIGGIYYDLLIEAAMRLHVESSIGLMPPLSAPGRPAPPPLAAYAAEADTVLFTGSASFAHSVTALQVLAAGTRIITFPVPKEDLAAIRYLADQRIYDNKKLRELKSLCLATSRVLDSGRNVDVVSSLGTDLTVSIAGRKSHAWYGIADADVHMITAWPPGETHVAALEATANGTVVADGYISGIGTSDPPLTLTFRNGILVNLAGGAASELEHIIQASGDSSRVFCEVGIGVNPWQTPTGTNADKNASGTWHFAIGTNASACFGGRDYDGANRSDIHVDVVCVQNCTVSIDETAILSNGRFVYGGPDL